jgi:hypothetical protein
MIPSRPTNTENTSSGVYAHAYSAPNAIAPQQSNNTVADENSVLLRSNVGTSGFAALGDSHRLRGPALSTRGTQTEYMVTGMTAECVARVHDQL